MTLPILILAAGASSRMAPRDKLLETIHGTPLLTRIAMIACEASPRVFATLPPDRPARAEALAPTAAQPVPVPDASEGMSASLRAGLSALPPSPAFMLLLADLPEITAQDLRRVLASREAHPDALVWRGATEDGKPGHPVIFAAALHEKIAKLQGDNGARSVVQAAGGRIHLTRLPGQHARCDLDTPEGWAAWRKAAGIPR